MKKIIRQAEHTVRTTVVRLKSWFDPPLAADAKPLELREAIIDDVERHVEPIGQGRRVLPHNRVSVTLLAAEKDERVRLEAALADLRDAIVARLAEVRCPVPRAFAVDVVFARKPHASWSPDQRVEIKYDSVEAPAPVDEERLGPPEIRVSVLRGEATQPTYTFAEPNVRIGRTATPVDNVGRPRRNHIVFVESGDEHSQTVGRAHASIHYDRDRREYRLFDDGSHNGTRLMRNGSTVDVHPRDPVGVAIMSGDEIEFGTAAVRLEIG